MGTISLKSALLLPKGKTVTKTPPIPSWRPFREVLKIPGHWTGLWGRWAGSALTESRLSAGRYGMVMHTAEVYVDVGETPSGAVHRQSLKDFQYLPMNRISTDLVDFVLWVLKMPREEKTDVSNVLMEKPSLVLRLFEHQEFKHFKAICWQAKRTESLGLGVIRKASDVSEVFVRGLPPPYHLGQWSRAFR